MKPKNLMAPATRCALAFAMTTAGCAQAAQDPSIAALETGLRPAVVFQGDQPWTLQERMVHYGVPAVAVAVIKDYQIAWSRSWGLADRDTGEAVTPATLFQAGSISKPVAAFGALRMVEAGKLSLDGNVNLVLQSWSLPDNEFTAETKVNLKHLLSHTGGLTVHGFPGYAPDQPVPELIKVLDGVAPANTAAIRVDKTPGGDFRYSGGGYTIVQQMMIDASGKPFPALMDELLIVPAKMTQSTFQQPLPPNLLKHAAAGVLPDGRSVPGKRHTYPEMAAAGLWTTADDLALFAITVQNALQGKSPLMSQSMARTMVTPVDGSYALGLGILKRGDATYFGHGGWDEGFSADLVASLEGGYGAVVMINSNHPAFINEVIQGIATIYGWDGYEIRQKMDIPGTLLTQAQGRYQYDADTAVKVYTEEGRLLMRYTGEEPEELFFVGNDRFMRRTRATPITFTGTADQRQFNFVVGDELQPRDLLATDDFLAGEVLENQGLEAGIIAYKNALEAHPEADEFSEDVINSNGLDSVQTNPDFAIAMLLVNTALYPDSANTWDSAGYAYRQIGNTAKAIEFYQQALKRDPDFASAKTALKELSEE